jgi:putative ABC transport system permease protein
MLAKAPALPDHLAISENIMRELIRETQYAARALWRHRAFTTAVTLTLSIGFGATVAVVSVYRAAVLHPLPVPEPQRLVFLHRFETRRGYYSSVSSPAFADYRARIADQVDLAAYQNGSVTLDRRGRLTAAFVSDGYFRIAAVALVRGRTFNTGDRFGAAIISDRLWAESFGRDESAIGRTVSIQNRPATIVGVMPGSFAGFDRDARADLWLPLESDVTFEESTHQRGRDWLEVVGRLRAGVSRDTAEAALRTAGTTMATEYAETDANWRLLLSPGAQGNIYPDDLEKTKRVFLLISAAVALLLLVTFGTAANLTIARIHSRTRELHIRLAIGAARRHLLRLVAIEHGLVAVGAAVGGTLLAVWIPSLLGSYALPGSLRVAELPMRVDAAHAAVTVVLVLSAGLALTLLTVPSWWKHGRTLRSDGGRSTQRLLVRRALVSVQVGISLILLFGGGLLIKALLSQIQLDAAFRSRQILMATVDLPPRLRDAPAEGRKIYQSIQARIAGSGDVMSSAWSFTVPYGSLRMQRSLTPLAASGGELTRSFNSNVVGADYFRTLNVPILRGRAFTEADREGAGRVAIVTESLAKRYWPGRDPIGQRLAGRPAGAEWTVVGVAPDGLHYDIRNLRARQREYVYFPLSQAYETSMTLLVASATDPIALSDRLRQIVEQEAPGVEPEITTSRRHVDAALSQEWLAVEIAGAIAAIAITLASLGLYGIVRYTVGQRTREIGIRIALGATPRAVVGLAVQDAAFTLVPGIVLGFAAAVPLVAAIRPLLHDVRPLDASVLAAAIAITAACVAAALWMPARDAARIEPAEALRAE